MFHVVVPTIINDSIVFNTLYTTISLIDVIIQHDTHLAGRVDGSSPTTPPPWSYVALGSSKLTPTPSISATPLVSSLLVPLALASRASLVSLGPFNICILAMSVYVMGKILRWIEMDWHLIHLHIMRGAIMHPNLRI